MAGLRTAIALLAFAGALTLSGCGSEPELPVIGAAPSAATADTASPSGGSTEEEVALDEYVMLENSQRGAVLEAFSGLYSDYTVAAEYPNTIVYTYTYLEPLDPDTAVAEFEKISADLDSQVADAVFPLMARFGVVDPAARFVYLNPDGTELVSHLIESE